VSPRAPLTLCDLPARHERARQDLDRRVLEVLHSGRFIGGPVVEEAERSVAELLGRRLGVGVGSGTDALTLALASLGVGPGDEVIVPAVSFFATVESVLLCGARPVIVDVREDRPLLDPDAVRRAMGPQVKAVVPVHLFGDRAALEGSPVPVVADGAQVVGADPPPTDGLLTAVSFYPTKVLGAAGDGGLVATDDPELGQRVRRLGSHGMTANHVHERVAGQIGRNSRLDAIQAAVLLAQLPGLGERLARRREIAARLDRALPGLALRRDPGSPVSVYVIQHPRRDELARRLAQLGIGSSVYYPAPMGTQAAAAGLARVEPAPNAERFCAQALALPCHEDLSEPDLDWMISTVQQEV
jgi:dTDP-4-amino-4,6-dideoxygalactose transaminase